MPFPAADEFLKIKVVCFSEARRYLSQVQLAFSHTILLIAINNDYSSLKSIAIVVVN